jgi:hypothetical protein
MRFPLLALISVVFFGCAHVGEPPRDWLHERVGIGVLSGAGASLGMGIGLAAEYLPRATAPSFIAVPLLAGGLIGVAAGTLVLLESRGIVKLPTRRCCCR